MNKSGWKFCASSTTPCVQPELQPGKTQGVINGSNPKTLPQEAPSLSHLFSPPPAPSNMKEARKVVFYLVLCFLIHVIPRRRGRFKMISSLSGWYHVKLKELGRCAMSCAAPPLYRSQHPSVAGSRPCLRQPPQPVHTTQAAEAQTQRTLN